MTQSPKVRPLPWLEPGQAFPAASTAWRAGDPAPGLLAAGGVLDVPTLLAAYSQGIFPWFSEGQPILWWSTDPRMVLPVSDFRLHRSLRKTIRKLQRENRLDVRFDHDFERVIQACSSSIRHGQTGTWILPQVAQAYKRLHLAGFAHSVETWIDGELAGGLYCVNLGSMVFGESMFARRTDASKIALSALVAFCVEHGIALIDCQQDTPHLATMGAHPIPRDQFLEHLPSAIARASPAWQFQPVYWRHLMDGDSTHE
jgi:leucyl/phenylalanyl-tRNA---protein transferase